MSHKHDSVSCECDGMSHGGDSGSCMRSCSPLLSCSHEVTFTLAYPRLCHMTWGHITLCYALDHNHIVSHCAGLAVPTAPVTCVHHGHGHRLRVIPVGHGVRVQGPPIHGLAHPMTDHVPPERITLSCMP